MSKFKVNYYLKPNGLVMIRSNYNTDKAITKSTGITLDEGQWKAYKAKKNNSTLNGITSKLTQAYEGLEAINNDPASKVFIKITLNEIWERAYPTIRVQKDPADKASPDFILDCIKKLPKESDKPFSRFANQVALHWELFQDLQHEKYRWNELNKTLLNRYIEYLSKNTSVRYKDPKHKKVVNKKPISNQTIAHHIKILRECARIAEDSGVEVRSSIYHYKLKNTKGNKSKIALTWQEVKKLEELEPKNNRQAVIRDIFLFCCYTGCRPNEAFRIETKDIDGYFISYLVTKNNQNKIVEASIHSYNAPIIKKYFEKGNKYLFPREEVYPLSHRSQGDVHLQVPNRVLKTIAKNAEIEGYEAMHSKDRHELVSMHVGRHTCNNLLKQLGVDPFIRREELGHAHPTINDSVYTKLDKYQRREVILDTWERAKETFKLITENHKRTKPLIEINQKWAEL